jgi:hypothetical protein
MDWTIFVLEIEDTEGDLYRTQRVMCKVMVAIAEMWELCIDIIELIFFRAAFKPVGEHFVSEVLIDEFLIGEIEGEERFQEFGDLWYFFEKSLGIIIG